MPKKKQLKEFALVSLAKREIAKARGKFLTAEAEGRPLDLPPDMFSRKIIGRGNRFTKRWSIPRIAAPPIRTARVANGASDENNCPTESMTMRRGTVRRGEPLSSRSI